MTTFTSASFFYMDQVVFGDHQLQTNKINVSYINSTLEIHRILSLIPSRLHTTYTNVSSLLT
ncbi:hypothetical protein [Cytobacillus praedii]|uniref:hypothetical protein n=1 Tax=Cytobacillus praedii TaxID=1742358 RepID=UPI003F7F6218